MTTTSWNVNLDGNWSDLAYWSAGGPNSFTDAEIHTEGAYTVTLSAGGVAKSLLFNSAEAVFNETASGSLNLATTFTIDAGTANLRGDNVIAGGVVVNGGLLAIGSAGALGTGTLQLNGGELRALANETLDNRLSFSGAVILSAANGKTLDLNGSQPWTSDHSSPGSSLTFGRAGSGGTVVWHTPNSSQISGAQVFTVEVAGGTLRLAGINGGFLTSNAATTLIDTGATLDIDGNDPHFIRLLGPGGHIVNTGGSAAMTIDNGGVFLGTISGAIGLNITGGTLFLAADNTNTKVSTIASGATLQLGSGGTTGSLGDSIVDNGALIFYRSNAFALTHGITGTGTVTYEGGGAYSIDRAVTYTGNTIVNDSTMTISDSGAFGGADGDIAFNDSSLLATKTLTLNHDNISLSGTGTIAAAHGKTLTLSTGLHGTLVLSEGPLITFGSKTDDGTVVLKSPGGATIATNLSLEVAGGTLKGDSTLPFFTGAALATTVVGGATLNFGGFAADIHNLKGSGSVIDTGGVTITLHGGSTFKGVISGATDVDVFSGSIVLTGANTYQFGTTINSGASLTLGNGHTTGTVVGDIVDNGTLFINHSNALNETISISGTGSLALIGTGTTTIDRLESYTGSTFVQNGELSIDRAGAISAGSLSLKDAELLATDNVTLSSKLFTAGNVTIAAASGKTLEMSSVGGYFTDYTGGSTLRFGEGGNNGTVIWHTPSGSSNSYYNDGIIDVHAGTLQAGDASFGFFIFNVGKVFVGSAGIIDVAGVSVAMNNLHGSGHLTNQGAATALAISGGDFSGTLNGHFSEVDIKASVALSGSGNFAGDIVLYNGAGLDLSNAWSQDVVFGTGSALFLHNAGLYTGTLFDFGGSDVIDLSGVDFTDPAFSETYNATTGVLTLSDSHNTRHLTFDGDYVRDNFVASANGQHGTHIVFASVSAPSDMVPLASEIPALHDWV